MQGRYRGDTGEVKASSSTEAFTSWSKTSTRWIAACSPATAVAPRSSLARSRASACVRVRVRVRIRPYA